MSRKDLRVPPGHLKVIVCMIGFVCNEKWRHHGHSIAAGASMATDPYNSRVLKLAGFASVLVLSGSAGQPYGVFERVRSPYLG